MENENGVLNEVIARLEARVVELAAEPDQPRLYGAVKFALAIMRDTKRIVVEDTKERLVQQGFPLEEVDVQMRVVEAAFAMQARIIDAALDASYDAGQIQKRH